MTRVIATEEGDWFLARIEGPRSVRTALRQSIPAAELEHEPDGQIWRIHRGAWPTACTVFSRFEIPIVWTSSGPLAGVPYGAPAPQIEIPPHSEAPPRLADLAVVESDRLGPLPNPEATIDVEAVHIEERSPMEAVLDVEETLPAVEDSEDLPLVEDVAEYAPAPEIELQRKEYEMAQSEYNEFTVTISGNGLTAERTVDSQTAWSILARLFGREATSEEALAANGRVAGR
jgi:hypothetical protein